MADPKPTAGYQETGADSSASQAPTRGGEAGVPASRRQEDPNAATVYTTALALDGPEDSQFIPTFRPADSLDQPTVPNSTSAQGSLHEDDSTTEKPVQETVPTVVPTSPPQPEAKPEVLPSDYFQQPQQSTQSLVPLTETEMVAGVEEMAAGSTKPSQESTSLEEVKKELKTDISSLAARMDGLQLQLETKTTENEKRIKQLKEEVQSLTSALEKKTQEYENLKSQHENLKSQLEDLKLRLERNDEEHAAALNSKDMEIKTLKEKFQNVTSELSDKNQECKDLELRLERKDKELEELQSKKIDEATDNGMRIEKLEEALRDRKQECEELKWHVQKTDEEGGKQPIEDMDTFSSAQPDLTSAPEEDSSKRPSKMDPALQNLAKLTVSNSVTAPTNWKKGKLLGSGAFGQVFLCHDLDTGCELAVKVIDIDYIDHSAPSIHMQREVKSFETELQMLKNLRHERIVTYNGMETTDGKLYIFMEYMTGGSIYQHLQDTGALNEALTKKYTRQILEGLVYLHDNLIVHRDIKGTNILRDSAGNVKLADFHIGASTSLQTIRSGRGGLKSVHCWMAPEVINEESYTNKADIWSIGSTVVEMLTCHPPWYDLKAYKAMHKIVTEETCPELPPHCSEHVKRFLTLCFMKDKSRRCSARELLETPFINT